METRLGTVGRLCPVPLRCVSGGAGLCEGWNVVAGSDDLPSPCQTEAQDEQDCLPEVVVRQDTYHSTLSSDRYLGDGQQVKLRSGGCVR
jgi:hypothetical protein